jgi:hypothetical protein
MREGTTKDSRYLSSLNAHILPCLDADLKHDHVKHADMHALFPIQLLTSEDEYKWYWHQMIYFPETINTISTLNTISPTHSLVLLSYAHHLLCACCHPEAMKGSSSLTSCHLLILSHLPSSLIWAQLTLLVPALGVRSPLSQDGAPIHRVHAPSLTGIRNMHCRIKCTYETHRTPLGGGGATQQGWAPSRWAWGKQTCDPFPLRSEGGTMRGWGIKNDLN